MNGAGWGDWVPATGASALETVDDLCVSASGDQSRAR